MCDMVDQPVARPPLLEVRDLARTYPLARAHPFAPREQLRALGGVSFQLQAGRSLGVVGESGSGKSTLARLVMALETPTAGQVLWRGGGPGPDGLAADPVDLHRLSRDALRRARTGFQMVFQDPYGSLDPRLSVERIVAEPLEGLGHAQLDRAERNRRVAKVLDEVGLRAADAHKYPHEFSGGQRQRIAIARALVTRPQLIVADEPVSALDVSVQAQVLNLMQDLRAEHGLAYLFISHDLAVVDLVCEDLIVLWQGQVVEAGPAQQVLGAPAHAYTRALIAAVPHLP
ncbi:MAG: ATP-binding cassette domain-containing protein [Burkholderiales bacterium]|nr:ATP-binding cassette domain-containing protein [Burkholderiales bacterium]